MAVDNGVAEEDRPGAGSLYAASLVASGVTFFMVLVFFCFAMLWNEAPITTALSVLLVGGFWGAFITIFLAFLVVGPIGTGIGLVLVRLAPPGEWLGAANGIVTGAILVVLAISLSPDSYRNLDFETLIFGAAFMLAGAIAGWMVQRWYLCWPVRPE